jgi:FlaA1/EpsC-like NDP-sugar epimerase
MLNQRRLIVFLIDILLISFSFILSFLLRFDFAIPAAELNLLSNGLMIILAIKPVVFVASGMYRSIWKYASLQDAMAIFKVVTISTFITTFAMVITRNSYGVPRSIYLLDWFLLFAMIASTRLLWRVYREMFIMPRSQVGKRTLIVGAGDAGNLLLKEIWRHSDADFNVIGFVDDDVSKHGMRLSGVPVFGSLAQIKELIRKHGIEEVIFAIPSAPGSAVRSIVDCCKKSQVRFKTIPSIKDIIDGTISVSQIKDVEIEDLLGRDPVILDEQGIKGYLTGKCVLVTGAAGSIGSEICRQVASFEPHKLILFDSAETPLYHIEKELITRNPELRIIPVLADVRNKERVEALFEEFQPEVVFHAAAYKHVPMMEYNPMEAVTNNIGGTRVLADAAHKHRVKDFVMISTDKAVNPTNIMGASKRVAEIYVQSLTRMSTTNFATVRFGNVLGSNGSVIPLFKEQIKAGGPITVTDPRVIRYFMTIPEACQLVLQAGCLGNGGEIFVLDMGEPVRIVDLAEELIRLSGLVPYKDVDIIFTGLRPGEKLFEELLIDGEGIQPTKHKKIRVQSPVEIRWHDIAADFNALFECAQSGDIDGQIKTLRKLVPEFTPKYSFSGVAPIAFQRVRPDLFPKLSPSISGKVLPLKK